MNHTDESQRHDLRRELRARRRVLTPVDQGRAAQRLAAHLASLRYFRLARRVALYLPNDGEIDPVQVMGRLWRMGRRVYLPVLSRLKHDRLWFAPYDPGTPLRANRFGILEPALPARHWVRAPGLDLVLMPLVAFDAGGNRLGMGGGFYDKSLAFLRHRGAWHKPQLVGLAHEFQRVAALAPQPWDVPLHAVVTDRAVYDVAPG